MLWLFIFVFVFLIFFVTPGFFSLPVSFRFSHHFWKSSSHLRVFSSSQLSILLLWSEEERSHTNLMPVTQAYRAGFFTARLGVLAPCRSKVEKILILFFGLKMRSGANMAALSCAECLQLIEHNRYVLRKRSSELGITVDDTGFPKIRRGSPLIMYPALVSTCLFPITEHEELHFTDASLRRPLFLTEVNAAGLLIARRRRRLIKLK